MNQTAIINSAQTCAETCTRQVTEAVSAVQVYCNNLFNSLQNQFIILPAVTLFLHVIKNTKVHKYTIEKIKNERVKYWVDYVIDRGFDLSIVFNFIAALYLIGSGSLSISVGQ